MQDIYLGKLGQKEGLEDLREEMVGLVKELDDADLRADRKLLEQLDRILVNKIGVDKETFAEVKKEHEKIQQVYRHLFAAIEDELITKGEMKLQL